MAVTIKQIAERAGVSLPTVSHVLNKRGHFSVSTREKVFAVARDLGYTPNGAARAMRNQKTRYVGVVYLNEASRLSAIPHAHFLIAGVNAGLEAAGYVLCLVRLGDLGEGDGSSVSRVFREKLLDGVVVLNAVGPEVEKRVEQLGTAVVWADTNHWDAQCCIRRDEREAGMLAARALLEGGSRRVVWVGPSRVPFSEGEHYSFAQRREGALAEVRAAGAEWVELYHAPFWTESLHRDLKPFLNERDSSRRAGFLAYDGIYRGSLVMTAAMLERRVPGADFALAACDDSSLTADLLPMMTRVEFDRTAMGRRAAEMIVRRIEKPEEACPSELHHDRLVAGSTAKLLDRSRDVDGNAHGPAV